MMVAVGKSLSESGEDVRGAVAEALGALMLCLRALSFFSPPSRISART
jgi:hypothetical protein